MANPKTYKVQIEGKQVNYTIDSYNNWYDIHFDGDPAKVKKSLQEEGYESIAYSFGIIEIGEHKKEQNPLEVIKETVVEKTKEEPKKEFQGERLEVKVDKPKPKPRARKKKPKVEEPVEEEKVSKIENTEVADTKEPQSESSEKSED